MINISAISKYLQGFQEDKENGIVNVFLANCESTKFPIKRRDSDKFVERKDEWEFDVGDAFERFAVHTEVKFGRWGVEGGGVIGDNIGDGSRGSGIFVQHIKFVYLRSQRKKIKYA